MEFIDGVAVTKTKEIQEMGINPKDVAKLLNHCFSQQIFEFGHVHSDPHPGKQINVLEFLTHYFYRKYFCEPSKRFFRKDKTCDNSS